MKRLGHPHRLSRAAGQHRVGNTNDRGTGPLPDDIGGLNQSYEVVAGANNLVGNANDVQLPPESIVGADPFLLPLADNGGPTPTRALAAGSARGT